MRRLLTVIALLACASLPAFGGPNEGGTLFLHDANLAYTTDISDYCGLGTPPSSCESADTQIDETTNQVWKVYAAFPAGTMPRLKAVAFGVQYVPENVSLLAWGPCGSQLEVPGAGWPGSDTGTSVVFTQVRTTELSELYWFAGYWYSSPTPATFALRSNPDQGGNFADDSVPAILDPVAGYGTLGFGQAGQVACPTGTTPTGACCQPDGTCTITTEADCTTGTWQGENTVCEPNPCTQPATGACCIGEACTITTEAGCAGTWQGADTTCDPNPCLMPATGACCIGEACTITTEAECTGTWQGADTVCDPNPCLTPPTGACCIGEACTITTEAECTGTWQGADTVCDPNPCLTPPTGACCIGEACTITTEAECTGMWLGAGTVCDPNPCITPPPMGACCYPDGTCAITTEAGCSGGTWQGADTVCEPNPCPPPPQGACCYPDGTCAVTTEGDCTGTWQGAGTSCDPNPCPATPTKNTTWGQIKNQYR